MQRVRPEYSIEEIKSDEAVINILFDLGHHVKIPDRRHTTSNDGRGSVQVQMPHSPHRWRGIKNSDGQWQMDCGN
ncbi:MAG: hypothetical protein ACI8VW_000712 [bacterium]|jgi:hypothetical protein